MPGQEEQNLAVMADGSQWFHQHPSHICFSRKLLEVSSSLTCQPGQAPGSWCWKLTDIDSPGPELPVADGHHNPGWTYQSALLN